MPISPKERFSRQAELKKRLNSFQELKRQRQGIIRRNGQIKNAYKSGIVGVDGPDREGPSQIF